MRYLRLSTLWFTICIALTACNDKPSPETKEYSKLFDEVIAVHDEVMPEMGKLNTLAEALKKQNDTTRNYQGILDSLQLSHKAMMDWMKDFSEKFPYGEFDPKNSEPEELQAKIEILKEEKTEVYEMRELMQESIAKAEKQLDLR